TDVAVQPTLEWNAATGATTYELQVSTDNTFATTTIDETGLTALDFTPGTALAHATEYCWRVRAVNVGGEGAWSTPRSFTTIVAAPDQVALSAPSNAATDVAVEPTLAWSAAARATTYELQVSTVSDFVTTVLDET